MTLITDETRRLIQKYASEFESKYLLEPAGQDHLARYKTEQQEVQQLWDEAKKANARANLSTDFVLEKLLPYANTSHNREMGYRISIAPAVTRDLKGWFENAGWQKPRMWDSVAKAIFDLINSVVEKNDWESLRRFEENESLSLGIKAGFITPTLHFLKPECRIVNNKTIDTVNFILGKEAIWRDLSSYRKYLDIIDAMIKELGIPLLQDADVFDAFCHWMCGKRLGGYARLEEGKGQTADEDEEALPAFVEDIEPHDHWEAIYCLVKTGNLLGYKTYVADPSRKAFGKQLKEIASLTEVPPILKSAPEIARVDAIWYQPVPPFFLFEVEDGGTMREALHRLYNAMAYDARFFVICPVDNRPKFEKWVTTAPFKEYESRYNFRTYVELFDFYKQVANYMSMRGRFLSL